MILPPWPTRSKRLVGYQIEVRVEAEVERVGQGRRDIDKVEENPDRKEKNLPSAFPPAPTSDCKPANTP
jgi:hypothetical protein